MLTAGSLSDGEEERDARSPERLQSLDTEVDAILNIIISIFARGGTRARNVIVGRLWPKADDFFGHYSATDGLMATDISVSALKVAKKAPYMWPKFQILLYSFPCM